jgi:hypothetical protein
MRLLRCSAVLDDSRIWYATTDADSVVDADWLVRHTSADTNMVLGVVHIATWREFRPRRRGATWPHTGRRPAPTVTGTCTGQTWGFAPTRIGG